MSAGDLGLQKGLITWFGQEHPQIILKKLSDPDSAATVSPAKPAGEVATPMISRTAAPEPSAEPVTPSSGIDSAAAASKVSEQAPPFPPSKTLTRDKLNGRLNKKVKGNMYLTAEEVRFSSVRDASLTSLRRWKSLRLPGRRIDPWACGTCGLLKMEKTRPYRLERLFPRSAFLELAPLDWWIINAQISFELFEVLLPQSFPVHSD